MPNQPAAPNRYVLRGRVITMGPADVLPDGALYIEDGTIRAVQDAASPALPGFADAPLIRTGGSIYPGLIELHNHLCYNAMPLWDVPRRYANNLQWRTHEDYRRLITKPTQVLGRTPGVVEALIRYVEVRCLLGGVTTSQGITLASAGGIRQYFRGTVRNVERPEVPGLPPASARIASPAAGEAQAYLARLRASSCFLQHLSEGVDNTARGWFHRLRLDDGSWAITRAFCGIHSTALTAEDFRILAAHGGAMVWSPLSNYLLYGATADIRAAKEAGLPIGIGSDWAPSGSKNLLGELKVAWLASQEAGDIFTPQEIVAMATVDAARILKWDHALGTVEAGKRADLVVIDGRQGDDYMRLIEARESSITLVVIDGVPRLGQRRLMTPFSPGAEEIRIGRATRLLNLAQDTAHPLVLGLTFAEAVKRLAQALRDLPELARSLDSALAQGAAVGAADEQGAAWWVEPDFQEEDEALPALEAALPLASFVQPMALEPATVVDDPQFLPKLIAARNLPEFVKKKLPALYGQEIPLPASAEFLRRTPDTVHPILLATTETLHTALRAWGELTAAERVTVVRQARVLLEENYVHLPFKRAMHAVDPIQRLRLLQHRIEEMADGDMPPEVEFHNELASIFNSLRDIHTSYQLPAPFKDKTAWLPFVIEEFWDHGHRKYMVSKTVGDAGPASFQPGVEVLYWNGIPIQRAVVQNADRQPGSNLEARHARGLNTLTIRPLGRGIPPDEEWVTIRYVDADGQVRDWSQEWLVFEPGQSSYGVRPDDLASEATALGMDADTDEVQQVKKLLFAGAVALEESRALEAGRLETIQSASDVLPTFWPTVFRAKRVSTGHGEFGHIRIFTFNVRDADAFVAEFVRLVRQLPPQGLILDVRGNGGGLIYAAERLLQILTPRRIEPQSAQFINSALNLEICRRHAPSALYPDLDLSPWIGSMVQSVETGATFSLGYPITDPASCNRIGQQYWGPVVLITDALCYSATDIFAAGFQDHDIGPILGVHANTGAGGANVWSHSLLRSLFGGAPRQPGPAAPDSPYAALPKGADLRVSVRRTLRVGANAGYAVEDLGIRPDHVHPMTRRDVQEGNRDLLEAAGRILAQQKLHFVMVAFEPVAGGGPLPQVTVRPTNLTRLDFYVNGRPQGSLNVTSERVTVDLNRVLLERPAAPAVLELQGYDGDRLALVHRQPLDPFLQG